MNKYFVNFKKKNKQYKILTLLFVFQMSFALASSQTQNIEIKGTVTEAGDPIPGVNVFIKGTTQGTITDINGVYRIAAPDNNTVLVFSFIGYRTEEILVGERTTINVELQSDIQSLDEVVVTGYGTNKRKNLTSAVAQIDGKDIKTTQATSIAQKLAGKVAGLNIRQNTGEPGSYNNSINIRGFGQPIFVIDGIIRNNAADFQRLSSEDIESVTVLKDASAAIYGINAANGVIIVTTKQGKEGKVKFTYSGVAGFSSPTGVPEMANAVEYLEMRNDANLFGGLGPFIEQSELDKWRQSLPGYQSTNWHDETFLSHSFRQEHNISASGGTEKVTYHINLGYVDDGSILQSKDLNYKRFNFRSNLTAKLTDNFTTHIRVSGFTDNKETTTGNGLQFPGVWQASVASLPTHSPYANNNPLYLNRVMDGYTQNPVALAQKDLTGYGRYDNQIIQTSFDLVYDAPFLEGLQFKALGAYDQNHNQNKGIQKDFNLYDYDAENDKYVPTRFSFPPRISSYSNYDYTLSFQAHIRYKKTIAEKHNLGAFFVYEVRERKRTYLGLNKEYDFFTNDQIDYAANNDKQTTFGNEEHERFMSYISRINYDYLGKYLIELTARYDGSYRYSPEQRWGLFPVISGGWRISEEPFIKENVSWISNLKLRASYGTSGQDAGAPFQYIPGYTVSGGGYWEFVDGVETGGVQSPAIVNNNLTWMESKTLDLGIDIGLFQNKVSLIADVYNRDRTGLLASRLVSLPNTFGGIMPQENLNSDRVRGIEFSFTYQDRIGLFNYSISGNVNYARYKTVDWEEAEYASSMDKYKRGMQDRLLGAFWMYNYTGQYQDEEDVLNSPLQGGTSYYKNLPGDFKYEDVDGNGVIDGNDIQPLTFDQDPKTYYGLTIACSWRGIDMNMLFQGAANFTARYNNIYSTMFYLDANLPSYFYDRWHKADPTDLNSEWIAGEWPASRLDKDIAPMMYTESNKWHRNASYLRLKNVELGYSIPKLITQKIGLERVRIFVSGTNLYTWTDPFLRPFDPESTTHSLWGESTGFTYPIMGTYSIGLNVNF